MKARLTRTLLEGLVPESKTYKLWDTQVKGLFVRVSPKGRLTFALYFRHNKLGRDYTLGTYPNLNVEEARRLARKQLGQVSDQVDPQAEKKRLAKEAENARYETLGAFIEKKYKPWVSIMNSSRENLRVLNKEFKHLHHRLMREINHWDVEKWRTQRIKDGLKPVTINRQLAVLKSTLSKAEEWGVITHNPILKVKRLKVDEIARLRFLSDDETQALLSTLDKREARMRTERLQYNQWRKARHQTTLPELDNYFVDHIKPIVLLAMNTGLRRGEIFNLQWRDINFTRRLLTVQAAGAKTRTTRHIPLNQLAWDILKTWKQQSDSQNTLVFPSPVSGERLDNITKAWRNVVDEAQLVDFNFHDLRHDFASKLVMRGIDLNTVRELLGHTSIDMTLRYAHLSSGHKAQAVSVLDQANTMTTPQKSDTIVSLGATRTKGQPS